MMRKKTPAARTVRDVARQAFEPTQVWTACRDGREYLAPAGRTQSFAEAAAYATKEEAERAAITADEDGGRSVWVIGCLTIERAKPHPYARARAQL